MRDFAKVLYNSKAWQRTRAAYTASVGGLCERCRAKGLIVPGEIVHHKIHLTPENIHNEQITLSFDNLELLCREHHAEEHRRKNKRYRVDKNGKVFSNMDSV